MYSGIQFQIMHPWDWFLSDLVMAMVQDPTAMGDPLHSGKQMYSTPRATLDCPKVAILFMFAGGGGGREGA